MEIYTIELPPLIAVSRLEYNAKIVTVDDQFSYVEAVAITGDVFTAVGDQQRNGSDRATVRALIAETLIRIGM